MDMDRFSFIKLYIEAIQDYLHRKFINNQYFSTRYIDNFLLFKYKEGSESYIFIGLNENGNMILGSEFFEYSLKSGNEIKYDIENKIKKYFKKYNVYYNIDFKDFDNEINRFIYNRIKPLNPTNDREKFEILKMIKEWKNRCNIDNEIINNFNMKEI